MQVQQVVVASFLDGLDALSGAFFDQMNVVQSIQDLRSLFATAKTNQVHLRRGAIRIAQSGDEGLHHYNVPQRTESGDEKTR
jgi:hypothetical protein